MYDWVGLSLQSYIDGKSSLTNPASVPSAFSDFVLWCITCAKVTWIFFPFCSSTSNCLRISYTRNQKYAGR